MQASVAGDSPLITCDSSFADVSAQVLQGVGLCYQHSGQHFDKGSGFRKSKHMRIQQIYPNFAQG